MTTNQFRGTQQTYSAVMVAEICCECGIPFMMPKDYQNDLLKTKRNFYCPNGHSQHYIGETEAEKLKRQLQQKENDLAQLGTAKIQLEDQLNKANRKLKRVNEGKCPCCDKTYKHLAAHMKNKHPDGK